MDTLEISSSNHYYYTMTNETAIDALLAFDFTEIEARIYCFLLEESPATGYRISHAIGKAAANTYKALTALERKGAIIVESGENRLCRATPPDELLAALSKGFESNRDRAKAELAALNLQTEDHRVYQLTTVEQVFARAQAMLESAEEIAIFDIMPGPAQRLEAGVLAARKRDVEIMAVLYEANEVFNTETCLVTPSADRVRSIWPGQQLNLVVDARQTLMAFLSEDCTRVIQAVWTNSSYLSLLNYNFMSSEATALHYRSIAPEPVGEKNAFWHLSLTQSKPPGLVDFLSVHAGAETDILNDDED